MNGEPCPRCGTHPVEVRTFSMTEPVGYLPRCICYPRPPLCVTCEHPLTDGRCENVECLTPFVLQPEPIADPLWGA